MTFLFVSCFRLAAAELVRSPGSQSSATCYTGERPSYAHTARRFARKFHGAYVVWPKREWTGMWLARGCAGIYLPARWATIVLVFNHQRFKRCARLGNSRFRNAKLSAPPCRAVPCHAMPCHDMPCHTTAKDDSSKPRCCVGCRVPQMATLASSTRAGRLV